MNNFFDIAHLGQDAEQTEVILAQPGVRLERIVSFGHPTPDGEWYDQSESEWVLLVQGEATLEYENGRVECLSAGSSLHIAPLLRHRVKHVSDDAIWLALFVDASAGVSAESRHV